MSTPKSSDAYPAPMHAALLRALDTGELFIPCPGKISPSALRLQFYGLISALRREGKTELVNSLGLYLQAEPPGLWIKLKDLGEIGALVGAALGGQALPADPPVDEHSALFARIMQGEKP